MPKFISDYKKFINRPITKAQEIEEREDIKSLAEQIELLVDDAKQIFKDGDLTIDDIDIITIESTDEDDKPKKKKSSKKKKAVKNSDI
jgi:hypothetical protein